MAGDFSDEEWDIPDDELQVLEHNAILSTQQQQQQAVLSTKGGKVNTNKPLPRPGISHLGTSAINHKETAVVIAGKNRHNVAQLQHVQSAESSFGDISLDEDGVPLVIEQAPEPVPLKKIDETTEREQWRVNRFAQKPAPDRPPTRHIPHQAYHEHQQNARSNPPAQRVQQDVQPIESRNGVAEHNSIEATLKDLQREKELLAQTLKQTNQELLTARGEIAIIRSKSNNATKSTERQLNILKKQMQEESAKHYEALQARDHAYNKVVSDKTFIQHEMDEQTRTIKTLQRRIEEQPKQLPTNNANFSPQKVATNSLRDGFDNDEVMMLSPRKSPAKNRKGSKPSTPTNRKRKQQAMSEVSVQPLVLRLSGDAAAEAVSDDPVSNKSATNRDIVPDTETLRHFRLVQGLLEFRPTDKQDTIIELLIKFAFPSKPHRSLGATMLSETAKLRGKRLPADLLQIMIDMLDQIVREKYYGPLSLLLSSINHTLELEPSLVDADIIRNILPPLQDLAQINAHHRWNLLDRTKIWTEENPRPVLDPLIDTTACLETLFTIAALVVDETDLISLFWRSMSTGVILLLLTSAQHVNDITTMLQLLETSILPGTFGPICVPDEQAQMETYIIDKVCFLFWDTPKPYTPPPKHHPFPQYDPKPDPPPPPCTRRDLCLLRLQAVQLLSKFVTPPLIHLHRDQNTSEEHHGMNTILAHPSAVARLTRCLFDEVENLYVCRPTYDLHAQLVNRMTAMLHHVLTTPEASSVNLTRILAGTSAGVHKFYVVLTRLAFGEGLFLDRGVSSRTVEMATEILEEYVTPDEAVALLEALGKLDIDDNEQDEALS